MLEVPENAGDFGFFGSYFPFSSIKYNFSRKRGRVKFVQRVFFRRDEAPLNLPTPHPEHLEVESEDRHIGDAEIADRDNSGHRFWAIKQDEQMTTQSEIMSEAIEKGNVDKLNGEKRKIIASDPEEVKESKKQKIEQELQ